MKSVRRNARWAWAALGLVLVLGLSVLAGAADKETRWAYVENQTNSEIVLRYDEVVSGGYKASSRITVYAGETKTLDATTIEGEVCAWQAKELQPAEKIACRTLSPGERWVIH